MVSLKAILDLPLGQVARPIVITFAGAKVDDHAARPVRLEERTSPFRV